MLTKIINIEARWGRSVVVWEHLTYAMSINTYSSQKLENLQLEHKEK